VILIIDVIGFNIAAENTNSYLNADGRLFIIQPFLDFISHFFKNSLEPSKKVGRMPYRN
jgi:uncharacterized membrane protein YGL010W